MDSRITPEPWLRLWQRGKADALHTAEGSNPRSLAAVRRGYHRGLRTRHASTGRTWELGRSNTLLKASRPRGSRVRNVPGLAEGKSMPWSGAKKRATERYRKARQYVRSPRDGVLEVLTERSTDGRSTGRILAVREGGEVRHKRPVVGKVKSDSASGGRKQERHLRSPILSMESHQTVWSARRKRRSEWCSSGWVPEASGEALARKRFLLRNRMSESFTYGSVGGVGYSLGGNSRGRPAPTRKRDAAAGSIVRGWRRVGSFAECQQLAERAPLMRMPICGLRPQSRLSHRSSANRHTRSI